MKILVTGSSGLVGSEIVNYLKKNGHTLYLINRRTSGDITRNKLGLSDIEYQKLKNETEIIFHCAALYDTAAPKSKLNLTNITGTRNLLKFAKGCPNLKIFNYLSTIYVSGKFEGVFPEDDLPIITKFHNNYEKSKYFAEKLVRKFAQTKVNIYRLPMVVGNSISGITTKFDGIYKLISLITTNKLFFYPGDCHGPIDLVPVDIAAEFIVCTGINTHGKSTTYNMVSTNPSTYKELIEMIKFNSGIKRKYLEVPNSIWKLFSFGALRMFNQIITFKNKNYIKALKGLKLSHPPIANYIDKLVFYYERSVL